MEIKVVNNTKVNVRVNESDDGSVTVTISEAEKKRLGDVKPGATIKIANREYTVLDYCDGRVLVITKDFATQMEFGNNNDYGASKIRKWLNEDFYSEVKQAVGADNIRSHRVDLLAEDGTNTGKSAQDFVSIPTIDLYRRYRRFLNPLGKTWWTATPVSDYPGWSRLVCCVNSGGVLDWGISGGTYGVRPFLTLDPSILNFEIVQD